MSIIKSKELFNERNVKDKFQELLGDKSTSFISSVIQVVASNKLLTQADPNSIYNAAAMAATLDLPINQSLGYAWIVPYKGQAQFQIGWKGFVQLALRTNQYKKINVFDVHKNQFVKYNYLTEELEGDFTIKGNGKIVGYGAYFCLLNGLEKLVYWDREDIESHAKKYSQSYGRDYSPWSSDFNAMARKTVLKNTLSKWGIMSLEMQQAYTSDQAVINDSNTLYPDNETIPIQPEEKSEEFLRIKSFIDKAKNQDDVSIIEGAIKEAEPAIQEELKQLLKAKKL